MSNTNSVNTFTPAPGYLLIEIIEDDNPFNASDRKPDDTTARKGNVLKVGDSFFNEFNHEVIVSPVSVGDNILFRYEYNQDELEVNFKKYPVIPFKNVRGKL